ncbi:MAG: sporulation integral membrane protein YtvI [Ruminococcaceae bacterium]|nr:sporulation integral membrane protein YtvI [Oscillospiraceae bacterium]
MQTKGAELSKTAVMILSAVAVIAAIIIFGGQIWGILSPFAFAWLISLVTRPLSLKLYQKTKIPQKLWAAVLIVASVAAIVSAAVFGIVRAWEELTVLLSGINAGNSPVGDIFFTLGDALGSITKYLPLPDDLKNSPALYDFWNRLDSALEDAVMSAVGAMAERIPAIAMDVARALPSIFLFLTVLLMSSYYFSVSHRSVWQWLIRIFGGAESEWGSRLARLGGRISYAAKRYARAYLILMLLTFAEMFVGFSAIGVEYAFLLAWLVAIVDFLPVLGAGTVLVPWAAVAFISGDTPLGAGLLIILGISLIIRQIAEPKIVGASLGLHPFASLTAVYVGFKLFGIIGMLLAPAVAMLFTAAKEG